MIYARFKRNPDFKAWAYKLGPKLVPALRLTHLPPKTSKILARHEPCLTPRQQNYDTRSVPSISLRLKLCKFEMQTVFLHETGISGMTKNLQKKFAWLSLSEKLVGWSVVVAYLVERSLPTTQVGGLNHISDIIEHLLTELYKRQMLYWTL